jgi:hypothetical protein
MKWMALLKRIATLLHQTRRYLQLCVAVLLKIDSFEAPDAASLGFVSHGGAGRTFFSDPSVSAEWWLPVISTKDHHLPVSM